MEQFLAAHRRGWMGVCGLEMERACDHPKLPAAVCYHHTRIDLSLHVERNITCDLTRYS